MSDVTGIVDRIRRQVAAGIGLAPSKRLLPSADEIERLRTEAREYLDHRLTPQGEVWTNRLEHVAPGWSREGWIARLKQMITAVEFDGNPKNADWLREWLAKLG